MNLTEKEILVINVNLFNDIDEDTPSDKLTNSLVKIVLFDGKRYMHEMIRKYNVPASSQAWFIEDAVSFAIKHLVRGYKLGRGRANYYHYFRLLCKSLVIKFTQKVYPKPPRNPMPKHVADFMDNYVSSGC